MGAAGRDFHNFNVCYRADPGRQVVAFTAAHIPHIEGRVYPPELAGPLYPAGIPICPETDLVTLILDKQVQEVIFAYSDVSHEEVMHKASMVLAAGADFCCLDQNGLSSNPPNLSFPPVPCEPGPAKAKRFGELQAS